MAEIRKKRVPAQFGESPALCCYSCFLLISRRANSSAFHVKRGRLGEGEGKRSLRAKLDVALRGDQRYCGSRGCANGPTDSCAGSAASQGADQDASASPAAHPEQVMFHVAFTGFARGPGVDGVVLSVHVDR